MARHQAAAAVASCAAAVHQLPASVQEAASGQQATSWRCQLLDEQVVFTSPLIWGVEHHHSASKVLSVLLLCWH